eukprot:2511883-Prymnesium_polylepis.1
MCIRDSSAPVQKGGRRHACASAPYVPRALPARRTLRSAMTKVGKDGDDSDDASLDPTVSVTLMRRLQEA